MLGGRVLSRSFGDFILGGLSIVGFRVLGLWSKFNFNFIVIVIVGFIRLLFVSRLCLSFAWILVSLVVFWGFRIFVREVVEGDRR